MILPLLELLDAEFSSVGSEYFINSQELEDRVRQLLPSQGGAGAGFDLSASTQIIPIIDLTESAEGSNVRQDLQTALSFDAVTSFNVSNATSTLINNTGYWRVFGIVKFSSGNSSAGGTQDFSISDGATSKVIYGYTVDAGDTRDAIPTESYDFVVFLSAGDSFTCTTSGNSRFTGCFRQIADIDGVLVNP
tara:strand:+ start:50 stop:622 length:573 start_codon:yes stop_codon:yes gene_type:complete